MKSEIIKMILIFGYFSYKKSECIPKGHGSTSLSEPRPIGNGQKTTAWQSGSA